MKKILVFLLLTVCSAAFAQTDYRASYERQVKMVGYAGAGVEGIILKWEAEQPDNIEVRAARINYHFFKGQTTAAIMLSQPKYLGAEPITNLRDSLGNAVGIFEDKVFDTDQFAECQVCIDRAIEDYPSELLFRENKVTTLMAFEKENPEMAFGELLKLLDFHKKQKPEWTFVGEPVSEEDFAGEMQQYCFEFYKIGTPESYEYFRRLSEQLSKAFPKTADFVANQASYYMVVKKDYKKAVKLYDKALKIDPTNQASIQNRKIAVRKIEESKKKK